MTTNSSELISAVALEQLKDFYIIANTPAFLYEKFLASEPVADLLRIHTRIIIDEFERVATSGVTSLNELVLLYALYTALLAKEDEIAEDYIEHKGKLHFEWFSDFYLLSRSNIVSNNIIFHQDKSAIPISNNWIIQPENQNHFQDNNISTFQLNFNHA